VLSPLALVLVLAALSLGGWGQKERISNSDNHDSSEQCIKNLRDIYHLLQLYMHQSAGELGFPSDLSILYILADDPNSFVCPDDGHHVIKAPGGKEYRTSYQIVNNPWKSELRDTQSNKIAIIAEISPNHNERRFVLFFDGSVKEFDRTHYEQLKKNAFVLPE
jgi:hypothetical protein